MSDNFLKTAVLKKRIVNLSVTGLYYQLMGAAPVPKFVRSLALDFPVFKVLKGMISSSNFVEIARLVVLARKDPGTKVPHKFQGKSLSLTEHSPSVFVTATVSNVVRF